MRALKFSPIFLAITVLVALMISSCRVKKLASPPHYKFSDVFNDKLEDKLKEISGIAYDSKNNFFLAINDEVGKLYYLGRDTRRIVDEYDFGAKGDYEDVAIYNGVPYILRSDGMIIRFNKDSTGKSFGVEMGQIPVAGPNDFETLYADVSRKALVLLCKNCNVDNEKTVTAFAYYPDSIGFDSKPLYQIDAEKVAKLSPFKSSAKFQPSAAAMHPVLHKLFILSAASRQLVVADSNGKVESVFKLAAKLFPQPEGITFKQNGDMYITNEGGFSKASMLLFTFIKDSTTSAPAGFPYDFAAPDDKMTLGDHLHEISGMAFIPEKNQILTENDEKGDIFRIDFENKQDKLEKIKFGGKGDYEDIVYTDSAIYMLISSGKIVKVNTKDSSFSTQEFELPGEKNEFETLYLDKTTHSLIMLCKECSHEKKTEVRTAYRFDLETNKFDTEPAYSIDVAAIRKIINDDQALFKPSAAAINPITGKLFIVASVGKLLVVATRDGRPEQVFHLDSKMYNQPEGITFAPNGDLYISNEGGEGVATILKFKFKK